MFGELRQAFRQAVRNFRTELHRDTPAQATDAPIASLLRDLRDGALRLGELQAERRRVEEEATREAREAEACRRRGELAERAGDSETAKIAREFGQRHERRRAILDEKARILAREEDDRADELAAMRDRARDLLHGDDPTPQGPGGSRGGPG